MNQPVPQNRELRFQRRTMLKMMMMATPMAGLAPFALLAEQVGTSPDSSIPPESFQAYQPRALDPSQWRTVRILSDWIIPADEISGSAADAGVPEFIDDWLDFQRGDLLVEIQYGLAWLDVECRRRWEQNFADCTTDQQKQMLDRIAYPQKAASDDSRAVAFFSHMRDLVLSGFYTSEVGIRDLPYVGNEPQSEWLGCPTPVLAKLGQQNT